MITEAQGPISYDEDSFAPDPDRKKAVTPAPGYTGPSVCTQDTGERTEQHEDFVARMREAE